MALPTPEVIEGRSWSLVPLVYGCDFETSKALVEKGSLQDCMNYEITSIGYERAQGLLLYDGAYDSPIENCWYVADMDTDATLVGSFATGDAVSWTDSNGDTGSGTAVQFDSTVVGINLKYELYIVNVSGASPLTATVFTNNTSVGSLTLTGVRRAQLLLDATDPDTGTALADTVTKYLAKVVELQESTASRNVRTEPNFQRRIPGTGPITGGFQFNDTVYAVRDFFGVQFEDGELRPDIGDAITISGFTGYVAHVEVDSGYFEDGTATGTIYFEPNALGDFEESAFTANVTVSTNIVDVTQSSATVGVVASATNKGKGMLWKAKSTGWNNVDLGYQMRFRDGTNAPNAQVNPLYLEDSVSTIEESIWSGAGAASMSFSSEGAAPLIAWTNPGNAETNDGSYATVSLATGESSELLVGTVPDIVEASFTEIVGVQVRIRAFQDVGSDVVIDRLYLRDTTTGAEYESIDLGGNEYLTTTETEYLFGKTTDMWGFTDKEVSNINGGNFSMVLQVRNTGGSTRAVSVDQFQMKVTYVPRGQTLYFYDTVNTTDVGYGDLYAYNLFDGAWANNDAEGWMHFHDMTNPEDVQGNLQIWTGPGGTGTQIGETASVVVRNTLPSAAEMAEEEAFYRSITANFYDNEDGEAAYVCTGASSAFIFDKDDHFSYIRLPIAPSKDKPRHVAFHNNHLVLGVGTHVLNSDVGSPNTFTGGSAQAWSVRDKVTGLMATTGTTTAIICEQSTHALIGDNFDPSTGNALVQNISAESGGLEYTVCNVNEPLYLDFNGVSSITVTDKYGNFATRPFSRAIYSWLSDRIQRSASDSVQDRRPVCAIPVRSKNQYRVYFRDGYIMSLSIPSGEGDMAKPMIGHYDPTNYTDTYVPTWIDSEILSNGRERLVMGTEDGSVYIIDGANGIFDENGLTEVDCWFTINPHNSSYAQGSTKVTTVNLMGDFFGAETLNYTIGDSYLAPAGTEYSKTVRNFSNTPTLDPIHEETDLNVDTLTDGFSIKIRTQMDGAKPHKAHTMLLHTRQKGATRNNTQRNRG